MQLESMKPNFFVKNNFIHTIILATAGFTNDLKINVIGFKRNVLPQFAGPVSIIFQNFPHSFNKRV